MTETATNPTPCGSLRLGRSSRSCTNPGGGTVAETVTVPIPFGQFRLGRGGMSRAQGRPDSGRNRNRHHTVLVTHLGSAGVEFRESRGGDLAETETVPTLFGSLWFGRAGTS